MDRKVLIEKKEYEDFANLIVGMLKEYGIGGLVEMLADGSEPSHLYVLRPEMIHHIEAVFEREFGFLYTIHVGRMMTGEGLLEGLYQVLDKDVMLRIQERWQALKEQAGEYDLPPAKGGTPSHGGL